MTWQSALIQYTRIGAFHYYLLRAAWRGGNQNPHTVSVTHSNALEQARGSVAMKTVSKRMAVHRNNMEQSTPDGPPAPFPAAFLHEQRLRHTFHKG
jgi:hypothetical protein